MLVRIVARVYALLSACVVAFQLALVAGFPLGRIVMGPSSPAVFPIEMRVAAIVHSLLIALFAAIVLSRADVSFRKLQRSSRWSIWVVAAFSGFNLLLNLITPGAEERTISMPVAGMLFISSAFVAYRQRHLVPSDKSASDAMFSG